MKRTEVILHRVAREFGIPVEEIIGPTRGRAAAARRKAAREMFGEGFDEEDVGEALNRSPATVRKLAPPGWGVTFIPFRPGVEAELEDCVFYGSCLFEAGKKGDSSVDCGRCAEKHHGRNLYQARGRAAMLDHVGAGGRTNMWLPGMPR